MVVSPGTGHNAAGPHLVSVDTRMSDHGDEQPPFPVAKELDSTCTTGFWPPNYFKYVMVDGVSCYLKTDINIAQSCYGGCRSWDYNAYTKIQTLGSPAAVYSRCHCCEFNYQWVTVKGCCKKMDGARVYDEDVPIDVYVPLSCSCKECSSPARNLPDCANSAHKCDSNADCTDTDKGYSCACRAGYSGNGKTCSRIYTDLNVVGPHVPGVFLGVGEDVSQNITNVESGYKTVSGACIDATKGAWATLNFTLQMNGTSSMSVRDLSLTFTSLLKTQYHENYTKEVTSYGGAVGISMPVFSWLGISASGHYDDSKETSEKFQDGQKSLDEARHSLEKNFTQSSHNVLTATGSMSVTGYSMIPSKACAFLQVAQITFADNTGTTIVNNNGDSMAAAEPDGRNPAPSKDKSLNIL